MMKTQRPRSILSFLSENNSAELTLSTPVYCTYSTK